MDDPSPDDNAHDIGRPPSGGGASDGVHALDVMHRQRACRQFSDVPVSDGDIAAMLTAASRAPSAENSQPWVFVVVREVQRRQAIWAMAEQTWRQGGRAASDALPPSLFDDVERGVAGGFAAAPVTIVVGADLHRCRSQTASSSVFPAVQNLLLAATELELGSALTTLATMAGDDLIEIVGLPAHVRPMAVIPVGHPDRPLGPGRRRPISDFAHRERFGSGW